MTEIMTPSKVTTSGQIDKAVANYRALLEKHSKEFNSEAVQTVLGQSELADEQFAVLRRRVEDISEMVIRHFKLDRTKTREQMISALKRVEYVDHEVLATMPLDGPDEGDLCFFPSKKYIPLTELPAELERRGLVFHYAAQMQVNADDPSFADNHPNGMQWGKNSFAAFDYWVDKRDVRVDRRGSGWGGCWWFAGVRKNQ